MSEQLSAKEYILLSEQRITKDITRCVRNLNVGECFEDFIAECEGVDSYVKDLEEKNEFLLAWARDQVKNLKYLQDQPHGKPAISFWKMTEDKLKKLY